MPTHRFLEISPQSFQLSLKVVSIWRMFTQIEGVASAGNGKPWVVLKRLLYVSYVFMYINYMNVESQCTHQH